MYQLKEITATGEVLHTVNNLDELTELVATLVESDHVQDGIRAVSEAEQAAALEVETHEGEQTLFEAVGMDEAGNPIEPQDE